jgi:CRISPR-associated protein Csm5
LPYIPGSSLKGALRNIIIAGRLLAKVDDEIPKEIKDLRTRLLGLDDKALRRNSRELKSMRDMTEFVLHKLNRDEGNCGKMTNDLMAAIKISDSKPLRRSDLTICEKIDRHVRAENGERALPTFRECLKPGVSAEFVMTVDVGMLGAVDEEYKFHDYFDKTISFTKSGVEVFKGTRLQNTLRKFNMLYDEGFRAKFECDINADNVIFLGGGSGFLTKTVLLALLPDDKKRVDFISRYMQKTFPKHKHGADRLWEVSPHTLKMTEYGGGMYEMGKCEIKFTEMNG